METTYTYKQCHELDLIDCNCSNCIFMTRDLEKYKVQEEWHRAIDLKVFEAEKAKAISDANGAILYAKNDGDLRSAKGLLRVAERMYFQFQKKGIIQHGRCEKFNKDVQFIPNHCQIETQQCFQHRRASS